MQSNQVGSNQKYKHYAYLNSPTQKGKRKRQVTLTAIIFPLTSPAIPSPSPASAPISTVHRSARPLDSPFTNFALFFSSFSLLPPPHLTGDA